MNEEVYRRADAIEQEFGPDIDEALARWEETGAFPRDKESSPWLSVAFVFARKLQNRWRQI